MAAVEGVGLRDRVAALAHSDRGCRVVSQRAREANMAVGNVAGSLGDAPDVRVGAAREGVAGMAAALAILSEPAPASRLGWILGIAASKG